MRRDRVTFGMMVGIPLLQLILFGYAINSDPKHLPTAILDNDRSVFFPRPGRGHEKQPLFRIHPGNRHRGAGRRTAAPGPHPVRADHSAEFRPRPRARRPAGGAPRGRRHRPLGHLQRRGRHPPGGDRRLEPRPDRPLLPLRAGQGPVDLRLHARYNPEAITQYNIVPGLMACPDHDARDHHLVGHHPRARTRHHGKPAHHPVRPVEVSAGQDPALHHRRYLQMALLSWRRYSFSRCPSRQPAPAFSSSPFPSSPPTWAWASPFPPSPRTSSKPCRCRFSFSCRDILLSGFMFPSRACRLGPVARLGVAADPLFCAWCAALSSKATAFSTSCPTCGRSACFSCSPPWGLASSATARPWISA